MLPAYEPTRAGAKDFCEQFRETIMSRQSLTLTVSVKLPKGDIGRIYADVALPSAVPGRVLLYRKGHRTAAFPADLLVLEDQ